VALRLSDQVPGADLVRVETGVPDRVAVPLPVETNLTPLGSAPVLVIFVTVPPDVVIEKLNGTPTDAETNGALVNQRVEHVVQPET